MVRRVGATAVSRLFLLISVIASPVWTSAANVTTQNLRHSSLGLQTNASSPWGLHTWLVIGITTLIVVVAALIVILLINRAHRHKAEAKSRRLATFARYQHGRLNDVISNLPGIVWEERVEPGDSELKVQFVSDYAEKMLGYSIDEFCSNRGFVLSIIHHSDREQYLRQRKSILNSGQETTHQFRWKSKDGRWLWAEAHMTAIADESGKIIGLRGVTQDITERKLAEEALRQSEQRNQDIVRALPDLLFLQSHDGTYLDSCTKESSDLLLPSALFVGKSMRDVLPPGLADIYFDCFRRAEETGEVQVFEYVLPIHGDQRWFEARIIHTSGNQFLSVVRNITQRKRSEAQLKESEARFRSMADTAPVMIWVSGPDKVCTWFNKPWLKFVGRPMEREVGRGWVENVHPNDLDSCIRTYSASFDSRQPFSMEYRLRRHDGEYRWVLDVGTPRYGADGEFVGYIGSSIDITESKHAVKALRERESQLAGIIGSAMDAIISVDEAHQIVLFNRAAEKMFNCSAEEAIGRSLARFLPEEFRWEHQQQVGGSVQTKPAKRSLGIFSGIYGLRSDGEEFPIEASISQTELNGQKFYTVILRDITERLKAEKALKESESNYRAIFNGVNDAIFIHDKATGAILDVNQRMCEMYGVTAAEAKKLSVQDLSANLPPFTKAALGQIIKAASTEPQFFEWRAKNKEGQLFWVEISLRSITFQGTERLLAMVHDNTTRKQSEEALQEAFTEASKLKAQLEAENIYLQEEIRLNHNFNEIIGNSEAIKNVLLKIAQVAPTDTTVLVLGETGTGKELVARALHSTSQRKDKPLVKINCAALPATLIESELFGHERGAFTSATTRQQGRFELANGGTIFLDEIGDLPLELQGKLLRVLQEGEFERLGSARTIKVNVRIIAATNRDLSMAVQKGEFREDLWYRLNVFPITVPPLRDRREDIPLLVESFVQKFSKQLGKNIGSINPATRNVLSDYSWPGNIRELANVIERAVINTDGSTLRLADNLHRSHNGDMPPESHTLEDVERHYILEVLEKTGWRIEGPHGAARILALHPSTLRTRMAKLGIQKKSPMQARLPQT